MAERLANRLNDFRAERGLTQAALAEMVGVSRKTINTVENGVFVPSTLLALKMARALGCSVEDLFAIPEGEGIETKRLAPAPRLRGEKDTVRMR
jgi:putative transcriptional regulator